MSGEDSIDRIAARTANMRIEDGAAPATPPSNSRWGFRLLMNPFESAPAQSGAQGPGAAEDAEAAAEDDATMVSVSPKANGAVRLAHAVPHHVIYNGESMQDRRDFILAHLEYINACNVLIAQGVNLVPLPIHSCIHPKAKRRIARFEWNRRAEDVTEDMWIAYFCQALVPTHIDFTSCDEAMKNRLRMDTRMPEPESRMTKLQADLEKILDEFNLAEYAYQHEEKKIVQYLTHALAPAAFKARIVSDLTQAHNKRYKDKVYDFCVWVREELKGYMKWERALGSVSQPATGGRGNGGRGGRGAGGSVRGTGGTTGQGAASGAAGAAVGGGAGGQGGRGGGQPNQGGSGTGGGAPQPTTNVAPCLKCGSTAHQVRECNQLAYEGEAAELLRAWRASRRGASQTQVRRVGDGGAGAPADSGTTKANVDGVDVEALLLDSGADTSLVARGVVDALDRAGVNVPVEDVKPKELTPVGGVALTVTRIVTLREVVLTTSAGPLMLRNLKAYVEEANAGLQVTVGRPIMRILGYSTDELLVRARDAQPEWELGRVDETGSGTEVEDTAVTRVCRLQSAAREAVPLATDDDVERHETRTATPTMSLGAIEDVIKMLETRFALAEKMSLRPGPSVVLKGILRFRVDCFRLEFGNDPPVKVAPLLVRLKPDAVPVKARVRRMPPNDRDFLDRHTDRLTKWGLAYRNPRSRWASATRIVRKREQDTDPTADPRMTIDERGVNVQTQPMPWPMPILEVVVGELDGATVFFVLDWFRGYWQLPLHPDCQELFTFITHRGMYTPTRVPMGATDSVAYCQQVVEEIFGDLIGHGILCWLDDILGYAKTQDELMQLLDKVLERCAKYGLKLHAKKCQFFATEVKWCGRLISASGIRHCPDRVQGLVEMQLPRTAGDLQQFLCAVNWMRQSIPEYNKLTGRLYATLERAMAAAGSRKKSKLAKFLLVDAGWSDQDAADIAAVREALLRMVPLAHPRVDAELCLYTDASQDSWGAVLTQLETHELKLPHEEQQHRPLAFLSGRFAGASARWATIEKEAFAIVEATRRLDYLLLRPRGFRLFTDHRNLVYIFNPLGVDGSIARYQADKLQRWALSLMAFQYVIEHIPGEENVWGDLLSRWGAGPVADTDRRATRVARLAVVERVSPLEQEDFVWPSEDEIKEAQQRAQAAAGGVLPDGVAVDEDRGLAVRGSAVWVPDEADLQQRLCVVAHAGASGHRGAKTTATALLELLWWPTLEADVSAFVKSCLHCMTTVGGKVPRPHGETLTATKPNELLHFDFLTMGEGEGGRRYVLVLKDGMSGFVELVACADATSDQVYEGLLDWFKRFGVVRQWVSDRGAHFKNQVMEKLQRALGAQHHFTTAYTPWANGTVEVVNREVLKGVKALLSERRLQAQDWPRVLPVIQSALNTMPADRLGSAAPITAFTALPAEPQLRAILHPREPVDATVEWVQSEVQEHLASVRSALDGMHLEMVDASEKRCRAARERHAKTKGVTLQKFSVGDFVLAATATGRSGNKLAVVWRGPKTILRALTDYTFEVQDLTPPCAVTVKHASRLQLYREKQRGVAEELMEQAIHGDGGHLVEELRACQWNSATRRWEVLVKWLGLDEIEASWEPATAIKEDVPVLFERFVEAAPENEDRQAMAEALGQAPRVVEAPQPLPVPRSRARKKTKKTKQTRA